MFLARLGPTRTKCSLKVSTNYASAHNPVRSNDNITLVLLTSRSKCMNKYENQVKNCHFLTPRTDEKEISSNCSSSLVETQAGGVVNLVCPYDLGHRDVTKREARNFEEFSKMAPLSFPNATFKVGFPGY